MHVLLLVAYLVLMVFVVLICRRMKMNAFGTTAIALALLLAPNWDAFLAKGIMLNFEQTHFPLQKISRTIEKPQSVVWIDEVWPGFDNYGRHWMVKNYLDGVHLQMLALNDGEGNIYLYQASPEDFKGRDSLQPKIEEEKKTIKILHEKLHRNQGEHRNISQLGQAYREAEAAFRPKLKAYEEAWERDIERIIARAKVYSYVAGSLPASLPPFTYQIKLHRLQLPEWQENFVWCDQIDIVDNQKLETIAFSKRCLGYKTKLPFFNQLGAGGPFSHGRLIGDERAYAFDDQVLFRYATNRSGYDGERTRKFSPQNNK
jgi:hypothetical protein